LWWHWWGPTASGKTALALELAEHFQLDILNIDSRQLYREMDIGTAKPTAEQQQRITHHLLDLRSPDQPITLQEFQQEAAAAVSQVLKDRGVAFLAGGSGLYLKALTQGTAATSRTSSSRATPSAERTRSSELPPAPPTGRPPSSRQDRPCGRGSHPTRAGSAVCQRQTNE
jgi:tRNA A37 N6-isopentenylltransferase MiaA